MDKVNGVPCRMQVEGSLFLCGLRCILRLIIISRCHQHLSDVLSETCCMALLKKGELPLHSNVRISMKIMLYQVNFISLTWSPT